ncbi:DM DNA binding domain-containing protein [Ditylenchus destructor]|nr:DM DNA binding domain-containing protein [Ditylenchus destructor]
MGQPGKSDQSETLSCSGPTAHGMPSFIPPSFSSFATATSPPFCSSISPSTISGNNSRHNGCSSPELDVVSCTPCPQSSAGSVGDPSKKSYFCQRCLNHGLEFPRKGHKPFCRYAQCDCEDCMMVETRRRLNNQLSQRKADDQEGKRAPAGKKIRDPKCARCSEHGENHALRGHKKSTCPYLNCGCIKCQIVEKKRKIMAKQIKLRRDQQKARRAFQQQQHQEGIPAIFTQSETEPGSKNGSSLSMLQTTLSGGQVISASSEFQFPAKPSPFCMSSSPPLSIDPMSISCRTSQADSPKIPIPNGFCVPNTAFGWNMLAGHFAGLPNLFGVSMQSAIQQPGPTSPFQSASMPSNLLNVSNTQDIRAMHFAEKASLMATDSALLANSLCNPSLEEIRALMQPAQGPSLLNSVITLSSINALGGISPFNMSSLLFGCQNSRAGGNLVQNTTSQNC